MTKDKVLTLAVQQVEVAVEYIDYLGGESAMCRAALAGLKKALAQPVQPADKDAEIARLTACLKAANTSAEKFEREWYLRGDEIEAIKVQPDNTAKLYEELRSIIDGGSESFTHADAVQYLKDNLTSEQWTPEDMAYRPGGLVQPNEMTCSTHPDAPHGFNRNASHNENRYVCDCEGWLPNVAADRALMKSAQEPVGFVVMERQPLTASKIKAIANIEGMNNRVTFARAIEAAHNIGDKT